MSVHCARPRRGRAALLGLVAVVALLVFGAAAPANAHATLIHTDPAEGAVLEAAPESIRLTFDEAVLGVPDGVQVFDAEGSRVASSTDLSGPTMEVTLDEPVGNGTLVVAWRVVSEDGHPISGSLSFSIGAPSIQVAPPPDSSSSPTKAPWPLSVVRGVGYVGMFLSMGLVAFTTLFLRGVEVSGPTRGRLVRTTRWAAAATVGAWLGALPLIAVYQLGGGASALTDGSTWSNLPAAEYVVAGTVVVGVILAVGLSARGQHVPSRGRAAVAAGTIAVIAPALTGHTRAATPEVLAVAVNMLHLVAGSIWLGGLVGLALVLPELAGRGSTAGEVLARFSGVAAATLAALVVTGGVLTWRIVGAWAPLVSTGYGLLLLVKIAMALIAVVIAAWNRYRLLPRLKQAARRRDREAGARLVARSIRGEAAVLVAVLLLTGLLVDRSPEEDESLAAAAQRAGGEPQTGLLGDVEVVTSMSPQRVGPNTITVRLFDSAGAPTEFYEPPQVRLLSDDVSLGTVPVTSTDPGTYAANVVLPAGGTWRLQVSLRTSKFDHPVATLEFSVGDG